jgi:hypothetical protein
MKKNTSSVYLVGAKSSGRMVTATVSAISKTANDQRDLRIPYSEASIRVLSQNFKRDTVEKI